MPGMSARSRKAREADPVSTSGFLRSLARTLDSIDRRLPSPSDVRSVMIVEDDPDAREILAAVLEHAGYTTLCVSNGREALAKLKKVIPGLIILDLRMPEMDGWAVDRALKADKRLRKIPVVVVSAFAGLTSARTGIAAEAWFQKPIDLEALLRVLPGLAVAAD